jgi:WhiB family redox-sensing transcriptional regulator
MAVDPATKGYFEALMRPGDGFSLHDLLERPAWMADAACREHPELNFHPGRGADTRPLREVCAGCLVRTQCLDYVMQHEGTHAEGFWAGLSARERRRLRRRSNSAA